MYKYHNLNPISQVGLDEFTKDYAPVSTPETADAILVRSAAMHEMEFAPDLKAIARAGAGVNNIPLEKCAEQGIVVFNTPGSQCEWRKGTGNCRYASCFQRYHRRYQLGTGERRRREHCQRCRKSQESICRTGAGR